MAQETKRWTKKLGLRRGPRQYHGYVDRFTLIGHCLYVEGWASEFDPLLSYDGKLLPISVLPVDRPDLEAHFSNDARNWGFAVSAMLPSTTLDYSKFRLRLNAGLVYDDPAGIFVSEEDKRYVAMGERFFEAAKAPGMRLLEIGSRARSGNTYRHLFPAVEHYTGVDIVAGPNVDVVADAHHLSTHVEGPFDLIFSMCTFEHLLMPWKVAIEMNSVMAENGLALIISHAAWPLHEEPWDYWRYSKEAWRGIFNAHTGYELLDSAYQVPASVVPRYVGGTQSHLLSQEQAFEMSGCLVRKTGPARVSWSGEMAEFGMQSYNW